MSKNAKIFLAVVVFLMLYGIAVLASAQLIESQKATGESYYFLKHQLFSIGLGLIGFFLAWRIDYRLWQKIALPVFLGSLVVMGLVFVPQLSVSLRGAQRWVKVGPVSFQPAEFVKITMVIYLASWLSSKQKDLDSIEKGLIPFLVFYGILAALFLLQPDMGSLVIIGAVGFFMYFVAGASWKNIILLLAIGAVGLGMFVFFSPYRLERVSTFLNPQENLRGGSYQLHQSLIALGSGGLSGKGYGQSMQKFFGFLPEVMTDSIFSVLGEELGFLGTGSVLVLFFLFFYFASRIGREAEDAYGKLLAYGIGILITFQALYNIGAMIGVVPLSGLPLPFFSYGGSSLVASLVGVGIVLSISKYNSN